MTSFDKILLAIIAIGAMLGLMRGLVKELIGTFGLIAAVLLANRTLRYATPHVMGIFRSELMANVFTFVLLFAVFLTVLCVLAGVAQRAFDSAYSLSWTNRMAGAAFGGLKFAIILGVSISAIQMLSTAFPPLSIQAYVESSRVVPALREMMHIIMPWVTDHVLYPALELLKRAIPPAGQ